MDRSKFEYRLLNSQGGCYGTTTDIYMLPIGTEFSVVNGVWNGTIIEQDGNKCMLIEDERAIVLNEETDYGLVIDIKEEESTSDGREICY